MSSTHTSIPVSPRISRFSYAIRNIVAEAHRVEAGGTKVRYLNVGDPVAFGFRTPPHLVEAVERALRDGHNGYGPSAGIPVAREAVAAENTAKGWPVHPDRVFITAGTSEGIDLALSALLGFVLGESRFSLRAIMAAGTVLAPLSAVILQNQDFEALPGISIAIGCLVMNQAAYVIGAIRVNGGPRNGPVEKLPQQTADDVPCGGGGDDVRREQKREQNTQFKLAQITDQR